MSGWWRVKGGHKTPFTGDRHGVADDAGVNLGQDQVVALFSRP
jgi:hypothetical protein